MSETTYPTQADGDLRLNTYTAPFPPPIEPDAPGSIVLRPGESALRLPPWTSDTPTKPGLYRYRESPPDLRPFTVWMLVEFWRSGEGVARYFHSSHIDNLNDLAGKDRQWQGPIEVNE